MALIWGGTFLVVQNTLNLIGPFSFLAIRFGLAFLALALIFRQRLSQIKFKELLAGSAIGLFLFIGYSFQTLGLQLTTTSKTGFITGLNVVIVPILAFLVLKQRPGLASIFGVLLATTGMGLLSLGNSFDPNIGTGELLVLGCAFFFACHIVAISRFAPGMDAINLAVVQIGLTALLSLVAVPIHGEEVVIPSPAVWGSALFMGLVGTAFTLVVMNRVQQFTTSTRAALIYALEPVFAGIFGYLAGESLSRPALIGAGLIFLGMVTSEARLENFKSFFRKETRPCEPLVSPD